MIVRSRESEERKSKCIEADVLVHFRVTKVSMHVFRFYASCTQISQSSQSFAKKHPIIHEGDPVIQFSSFVSS